MALTLYPAVDVSGGCAVRLIGGRAASQSTHGDPVEAALAWQHGGAEWIHLVDLDAAFGRGANTDLLARVIAQLEVKVQLSGGIADDRSLAAALAAGPARVIIATAALADPVWCERIVAELGARVAVGLDVRDRTLRARGGSYHGGDLHETLRRLDQAGCARYVVTDVARDGAMLGPNLELLAEVCARTTAPVIASGGVSSLADLRALSEVDGVEGAIAGSALYAGAFTVAQALAALAP
jgi:phosphoribosyl isomerase A